MFIMNRFVPAGAAAKPMTQTPRGLPALPKAYCSYLVRLWQDDDHVPWRASAQSVQTNETIHFKDLESLYTFLSQQTDQAGSNGQSNSAAHAAY